MDTRTGEIRSFPNQQDFIDWAKRIQIRGDPPPLRLARAPKPDCTRCFGRGYTGKNTLTNLYIPCRCCT